MKPPAGVAEGSGVGISGAGSGSAWLSRGGVACMLLLGVPKLGVAGLSCVGVAAVSPVANIASKASVLGDTGGFGDAFGVRCRTIIPNSSGVSRLNCSSDNACWQIH